MENQAFFSSKDKSKKLKNRLLQFLFGALSVNCCFANITSITCIIIKNSRHIFRRKFIRSIADQHTRLADCPIPDDDAFDVIRLRRTNAM